MRIAISELDVQKDLCDIGSATGGAIIGGKAGVEVYAESFAEGDFTVTDNGTGNYGLKYENEYFKLEGVMGFSYGTALSFNLKS